MERLRVDLLLRGPKSRSGAVPVLFGMSRVWHGQPRRYHKTRGEGEAAYGQPMAPVSSKDKNQVPSEVHTTRRLCRDVRAKPGNRGNRLSLCRLSGSSASSASVDSAAASGASGASGGFGFGGSCG